MKLVDTNDTNETNRFSAPQRFVGNGAIRLIR